jgi:hypothetical protein
MKARKKQFEKLSGIKDYGLRWKPGDNKRKDSRERID